MQAEAKIQTNDDGDVFIAYGGDGGYDQPYEATTVRMSMD